ncbi:TadE/TadG family type IV pilus assembly protein [Streptomyces sp. NPDC085529]|uniref:TadE/TadG family type IV pilus assembly protein n=1 Tax=Streptomyces sp. NPDC085529 TaxID=3365729 RepID=UPI0037CFFFE6
MIRKRVGRAGARPGGPGPRGAAPRSRTPSCPSRRDRGQVALEYLGFLPLLLIVGLAGLQLGLAAYAAQQAGTAARAAARAATRDVPPGEAPIDPGAAAEAAVSGWIDLTFSPGGGGEEYTATVTVQIPQVVPFWDLGEVTKTATMPLPAPPEEGP